MHCIFIYSFFMIDGLVLVLHVACFIQCIYIFFYLQVILDSPLESTVINNYARIPMERVTSFSVIPNRIWTDLEMKSLTPENRKCYLDGEIELSYFDFYTMNNCILECEIKYIAVICGCIPFFAKSKITTNNKEIKML